MCDWEGSRSSIKGRLDEGWDMEEYNVVPPSEDIA